MITKAFVIVPPEYIAKSVYTVAVGGMDVKLFGV